MKKIIGLVLLASVLITETSLATTVTPFFTNTLPPIQVGTVTLNVENGVADFVVEIDPVFGPDVFVQEFAFNSTLFNNIDEMTMEVLNPSGAWITGTYVGDHFNYSVSTGDVLPPITPFHLRIIDLPLEATDSAFLTAINSLILEVFGFNTPWDSNTLADGSGSLR